MFAIMRNDIMALQGMNMVVFNTVSFTQASLGKIECSEENC